MISKIYHPLVPSEIKYNHSKCNNFLTCIGKRRQLSYKLGDIRNCEIAEVLPGLNKMNVFRGYFSKNFLIGYP